MFRTVRCKVLPVFLYCFARSANDDATRRRLRVYNQDQEPSRSSSLRSLSFDQAGRMTYGNICINEDQPIFRFVSFVQFVVKQNSQFSCIRFICESRFHMQKRDCRVVPPRKDGLKPLNKKSKFLVSIKFALPTTALILFLLPNC